MALHFCPIRSKRHDGTADTAAEPANLQNVLVKPQLQPIQPFSSLLMWQAGRTEFPDLVSSRSIKTVAADAAQCCASSSGSEPLFVDGLLLTCWVLSPAESFPQTDDSAYDTSSIKLSYCCTVLPEKEGAPICAPHTWALAGLSWLYGGSTHDVTHVKSIWIKYLCYKAWGLVWNNNNNKMFLNGRHFLHAALIKTLIFLIITKPWSQSKCCS